MDYKTIKSCMLETPLPDSIIDDILSYMYDKTESILWFLIESKRLFNINTLNEYSLDILRKLNQQYLDYRECIIQNINRNDTLRVILEQDAIPTYADLCILKGWGNYTRLLFEQIEIGECTDLKIVRPLKALRKAIFLKAISMKMIMHNSTHQKTHTHDGSTFLKLILGKKI